MLSTPKAILFDWDNTLVNTWPTIHEALNHCLREMGHDEWSVDKVKSHVKKSMRDSFPELFGNQWEDAAHIYQEYYRSIHLRNLQALEGAEAVLQWLKTQPVYVAVVSNKRGPSLRTECDHIGWNDYFDRIVGADDAERDKPDPAPAIMALDQSSVSPDASVWFIGDTVIDLECANNLGVTPILYGDVPTDGDSYDGHAFMTHVKDHMELLQLFQNHLREQKPHKQP